MTKRELIYGKYNGLCAYTGKPLGDDWQIDHMNPLHRTYEKFLASHYKSEGDEKDIENLTLRRKKLNSPENLLPSLRIVNFYKGTLSVEGFRKMIAKLHEKLYKKDGSLRKGMEKAGFLLKIAEVFSITKETPFCGKFYFERVNDKF